MSTTKTTNKLQEALEAGKTVNGIIGYVETDLKSDEHDGSSVLMKIKCIRVEAEGCGIEVIAVPMSGVGEFKITPCRFHNSQATYKKKVAHINLMDAVIDRLKSIRRGTKASFHAKAHAYLMGTELGKKALRLELDADGKETTSIESVTSVKLVSDLKTLLLQVACDKCKINLEELENHAGYRWW